MEWNLISERNDDSSSCGNSSTEMMKCEPRGESIDESVGPESSQNIEGGAEKTLWTGHPSYLTYIVFFILGVVCIALGALYFSHLFWMIPLGVFLEFAPIIDRKSNVYTITNTKIRAKANIHRYIAEILIKDIINVDLQKRGSGKLFGLGNIKIVSGDEATVKVEIALRGISNPQRVLEKIKGLRDTQENN